MGCTDSKATNYNASATMDDGSCKYPLACEVNKTGEVYFINHSNTNSTYDIVWDGATICTLNPNQSSRVFTFSANMLHSLQFKFTNTGKDACTLTLYFLIQCQTWWFDCSG